MFLALASMMLTPQAGDLSAAVTLKRTESVEALLKDISKQAGIPLSTSGKRAKEILIVVLNGVPVSQAMQKIAWATYGRWEQGSRGNYRLVSDTSAERAAEKHYVAWQGAEAANAIEILRNRVQKQGLAPEVDPEWAWPPDPKRENNQATPMDFALAEALGRVRPETLVLTKPDTWCVYSDLGLSSQNRFTKGADEVLNAFNSRMKLAPGEKAEHVILTCEYQFGVGHAKLELYNGDRTRIGSVRALMHPDERHRPTNANELADEIAADTPIPLSPASLFFVERKLRSVFYPSYEELEAMPELGERMRNPETYEPLGTIATDAWRAVGVWKNRSVVANIDDVYLFPYWTSRLPTLREAFRTSGGYNAEVQPGWIVARPSLPTPPWQHRLDRTALGQFARSEAQTPFATFMNRAKLAGALDSMPDSWTLQMYADYARISSPRAFEGWGEPRAFGTLTDEQRQILLNGGSVPVASLPDASRAALRSMSYNRFDPSTGLEKQLTVRFPNGLPDQGQLISKIDAGAGYYFRLKNEQGAWIDQYLTVPRFADWLKKHPADSLKTLQVRYIEYRTTEISATIEPAVSLRIGSFYEPGRQDPDFIPWDRVPADEKRQLMGAGQ